ncbi:hypothetical protein BJV82DRAFT_579893 [Fennellomyces sp. T-0311]|nr:hypothetical protein BJV82DRAFT_579893 [Fennellomyces sp. T-0311]
MAKWTAEDRKVVISTKKANKYWNWDKIAQKIDFRHSPASCRIMFQNRNPNMRTREIPHKRVREESPPWTLAQRRRMAKLRNMDPPTSWDDISKDISTSIHNYHPPESCEEYFERMMPMREKGRGMSDAMSAMGTRKSNQGARKRDRAYRQGLKKTWTSQRWMPDEEDELVEMCTDRVLAWEEIAASLKRSVTSCQAKWRQLEAMHYVASNKKSKGKVVKNKAKKAAGANRTTKNKNGSASPTLSAGSSPRSSPGPSNTV